MNGNITVEKATRHHFSRIIKISISNRHTDVKGPLLGCTEKVSSMSMAFNLIMRKIRQTHI